MRLRIAWATDPGLEREENEDSVAVWRNKAGLDTLIVVCDGMGGHAAGQHASSIAVKTITKVLAEDGQEGPDVERLKRAVGVWEQIQAFTDKIKLEEGDAIVLCSDGVETAGVSVDEMGRLLLRDGNLDRGAERVIERCRELGAPDNVTLAVARVEVDVTKTAVLPKLKR